MGENGRGKEEEGERGTRDKYVEKERKSVPFIIKNKGKERRRAYGDAMTKLALNSDEVVEAHVKEVLQVVPKALAYLHQHIR